MSEFLDFLDYVFNEDFENWLVLYIVGLMNFVLIDVGIFGNVFVVLFYYD